MYGKRDIKIAKADDGACCSMKKFVFSFFFIEFLRLNLIFIKKKPHYYNFFKKHNVRNDKPETVGLVNIWQFGPVSVIRRNEKSEIVECSIFFFYR